MKKIINFSKAFLPCAIVSLLIIAFGVVGFFTKGINLALDFKPGLIEEVRLSDPAMSVTYSGVANATIDITKSALTLVISGTGAENKTTVLDFATHPTLADIAKALNEEGDINATVLASLDGAGATEATKTEEGLQATEEGSATDKTADKNAEKALDNEVAKSDTGVASAAKGAGNVGAIESFYMFLNSDMSTKLSDKALYIYAKNKDTTIDDVRKSLADIEGVALKELGAGSDRSFQVRMAAKDETDSNQALKDAIKNALKASFGENSVVITKADFIGAGFSKSLAKKSFVLLLCTILLIWVYAALRFHWDFALGSVIALVHDTLIMFTFIIWSRLEFGTTVLAAVLTIIGYSINATVVILDRVRFNLGTAKVNTFNELLDGALTDTLRRSIITTVTTLFAVISLFIFTTGAIKDFACALIVGLLSGCYSSIFISSGFISLLRRNWKPEFGIHHSEKSVRRGELDMGVSV